MNRRLNRCAVAAAAYLLLIGQAHPEQFQQRLLDQEGNLLFYLDETGRITKPDGATVGFVSGLGIVDQEGNLRGCVIDDNIFVDKSLGEPHSQPQTTEKPKATNNHSKVIKL